MPQAHYFCFGMESLCPVPYWHHGCVAFCLQRVFKAIFPATAFGSEQQRTRQRMAFRTIKFKPLDVGQAQPIRCTFVLLQSRCLDCRSSFLSWPLVYGLFQVHWDLFLFAQFCIASPWACWAACSFLELGLETVSAALESLLLGLAAFVGCMPIGLQRPIDSPSEPLASVSCVFGGMYQFYFLFRSVGFGAWKFGGLGPFSTLFVGPSFSKHLGGKGMVVATHRVVMDTLRVRLEVARGPTFLISGTIPHAYLLLMSLILNSTFNFTGNKWSSLSTGVIWATLGIKKHVTQATTLRTFWSWSYWYCGSLYKRELQ